MVKWRGVSRMKKGLSRHARQSTARIDNAINDFGTDLEEKIATNAVFTKGYSKGNLRKELEYDHQGNMRGKMLSPAYYSGWVEHGTRYMDAQPFFFPTIDTQKVFLTDYIKKELLK